jgi:hypothetical protein
MTYDLRHTTNGIQDMTVTCDTSLDGCYCRQLLLWYLGEATYRAFRATDWYDNFEFFNIVHRTHADKLKPWPAYKVKVSTTIIIIIIITSRT